MSDEDPIMRCNAAGIALIKRFESCSLTPYRDGGGVLSIGWGHTGQDVMPGLLWTQEQADAAFLNDLYVRAEEPVWRLVTYELDENQYSSIVSLCYNIGAGNFAASSVLKIINDGDFEDVPDHIILWDKDHKGKIEQGLITRRAAEVELWNTLEI